MKWRVGMFAPVAAVVLAACAGTGSAVEPVVGVWPAAAEREFVDTAVASGFFDDWMAQCVLEHIQARLSLAEYEQALRDESGGEQNAEFSDAFVEAIDRCATLRARDGLAF